MEMTEEDNLLKPLAEMSPSTPVHPVHGIAAMALTMALKFHDINTVQDGALYQQFKLEGKNMRGLDLIHVFETAMRIEEHLLRSEKRLTKVMFDMLAEINDELPDEPPAQEPPATPDSSV
jgi:hypothetical protein